MEIRDNFGSYMERWNALVERVIGNVDIYDYHNNIVEAKNHIVADLTKGSVRLKTGMIISVPESDKMEKDFINIVLPY